ncbi:MAG TPA: phosphate acetyltransferase [Candidatus Cloacimonadota bacterium]|nr:phosphate acetyltransferase [Candidatus Cloacimonadota bacterium]HOQ79965.1 phosphate acetyltransferase [Candidatus Cloacimonadota bacterium]HPK40193.1 phosphate acetyltransferase [Candidatus Cloacimonadota bacterium]
MDIIKLFKDKAKALNGTIVLPEAKDERMLKATEQILKEKLAKVVLIGKADEVNADAKRLGVNICEAEIINPADYKRIGEFADFFYEKRKAKGVTQEQTKEIVLNPLFFGALLVQFKVVNGMVAGALNTTGDVLKSALQVIGVKAGLKTVSSSFIMVTPNFMGEDRVFLFGDCAVVPNPTAEQLADIAISTATTRSALLGDEPKVALLSFSTKGSAEHELVDKVRETCKILAERKVDFDYDGELQADAAIVPKVGASKAPNSKVAGNANVLIFPDLQSGNIGYKLVQRFANAEAVGPIIQGLAAPVCDLSRGCSVEDIINTTALVLLISQK